MNGRRRDASVALVVWINRIISENREEFACSSPGVGAQCGHRDGRRT